MRKCYKHAKNAKNIKYQSESPVQCLQYATLRHGGHVGGNVGGTLYQQKNLLCFIKFRTNMAPFYCLLFPMFRLFHPGVCHR